MDICVSFKRRPCPFQLYCPTQPSEMGQGCKRCGSTRHSDGRWCLCDGFNFQENCVNCGKKKHGHKSVEAIVQGRTIRVSSCRKKKQENSSKRKSKNGKYPICGCTKHVEYSSGTPGETAGVKLVIKSQRKKWLDINLLMCQLMLLLQLAIPNKNQR